MVRNAKALTNRLQTVSEDDGERIREAYSLLYARPVTERELEMGLQFLNSQSGPQDGVALSRWEQYAQVLLSANEFMFVD